MLDYNQEMISDERLRTKLYNSTDFKVNTSVYGTLAQDRSSLLDCFRGRTVTAVTSKVRSSSFPSLRLPSRLRISWVVWAWQGHRVGWFV